MPAKYPIRKRLKNVDFFLVHIILYMDQKKIQVFFRAKVFLLNTNTLKQYLK